MSDTRQTSTRSIAFDSLTIYYDDQVLSPRPWTEAQATWASELLDDLPQGPVLELCSGAGQIGLAAVNGHDRTLVAVDANPAACDWMRYNASANGIPVEVREGDLADVLETAETFPLIIADPPWVPRQDVPRFPADPLLAIDGGTDGLEVARLCLGIIDQHLAPGGAALLQLGDQAQVAAMSEEIRDAGLVVADQLSFERGVVVRLVQH